MNKEVKSVHVTVDSGGGKTVVIDETTVYRAVNSLEAIHDRVKVIHVSMTYKQGEKKKANFDSKSKAISWLNLNDTKE